METWDIKEPNAFRMELTFIPYNVAEVGHGNQWVGNAQPIERPRPGYRCPWSYRLYRAARPGVSAQPSRDRALVSFRFFGAP